MTSQEFHPPHRYVLITRALCPMPMPLAHCKWGLEAAQTAGRPRAVQCEALAWGQDSSDSAPGNSSWCVEHNAAELSVRPQRALHSLT